MVGGASVHISKHSLFRLKITVGCRLCAYPSIRVCVVWCVCNVYVYVYVCVDMVVRMCVVVCTLCCGVVCSVGGVWCGVVLCCFMWCGAAWHAKTPPSVPGKRPHVLNMLAFSGYTLRRPERTHRRLFESAHGGVFRLLFSSLFSLLLSCLSLSLSLSSLMCLSPLIRLSFSPSLLISFFLCFSLLSQKLSR